MVDMTQMIAAESENLKIIKRKLKAMDNNKTSMHYDNPRKLADWLKQIFHRKNRHGLQQLFYLHIFTEYFSKYSQPV